MSSVKIIKGKLCVSANWVNHLFALESISKHETLYALLANQIAFLPYPEGTSYIEESFDIYFSIIEKFSFKNLEVLSPIFSVCVGSGKGVYPSCFFICLL